MRSVRDTVAVAACICLLGVGAAGCSTTQEKAAVQKAKSEHILKARAEREAEQKKKNQKNSRAGHHKSDKQKGKK